MKNLDEIRALGEAYKDWAGETGQLARAVLEMLPIVEAANDHHARWLDAGYKPHIDECKLCQAVAAFRAANREGETKAT